MRGYPEHLHEVINEDLQESIYDESLEEIGELYLQSGLTMEQERKAINYTIMFLKGQIMKLDYDIEHSTHETSKQLMIKRLRELEKDLIEFELIGDRQ